MSFAPVTVLEPTAPHVALLVDSPHSGRIYPADFAYTCPLPMLRQTEDFLVDELVASATQAGAAVVTAEFPRCYIDVNRAENDVDPAVLDAPAPVALAPGERTLLGLGLVRRLCKSGVPIYASPLPYAEIERRLATCYRPYYAVLTEKLEQQRSMFGASFLINAHSMPAFAPRGDLERPDFELGDRDGTTCGPWLTAFAKKTLQDMGYTVRANDLFKGQEIVRRYGQPQHNMHALQIEMNRALYMNEAKLEKNSGFERTRADLTQFFALLAARIKEETSRVTLPHTMAAE